MRYLSNCLTNFGEILYGDAYQASQSDGRPKISKFQNPRWLTVAILKIKKLRYLQTVWSIMMKFCTMTYISPLELTSCSKDQNLKSPRWRTAAILKIVKCYISATVWPILVKFSTTMHISLPRLLGNQKFKNLKNLIWRTSAILKLKNYDIL